MNFMQRFDSFHEQARQMTGLDDFGTTDYVEPLKLLLTDWDNLCHHTPEGDAMSCAAIVGPLASRLFAQKSFKEYPHFAATPIEKPIIITGMPRTGSTTLQKLLALDPDTQWLPPWLGAAPMPRPQRDTWESHPIFRAMEQGIEQIYQLAPGLRDMHPMVVGEADECRFALDASFWSPGQAFSGPTVGGYAAWLKNSAPHYAYRYYRKVLGVIAGDDKRQWILKDPTSHPFFGARALIEAFPDGRFVYTHRDPVSAMSSIADMMYGIRRLRMEGLTREQHGRDLLPFFGPAIDDLEQAFDALDPSRIIHVHMKELQADPIGTAERIYRHFDIPVRETALAAWRAQVEADPRIGHGDHRHKAEASGFNAAAVHAAMPLYSANYLKRYGAVA